jgi:SRSO17 transposase
MYGGLTCTKTRDTSHYGYHYLSGLLRMETERTIVNISRLTGVSEQNMHHYISESPWSGHKVIEKVGSDIAAHPYFATGNVLLLDESADDKAGEVSVGAARQYNGRRGKVDVCQVGVFVSIAKNGINCWIDGEIFIPEHWFDDVHTELRKQVGIPKKRTFQTKLELGWELVQRAQARGMPFEAVACDTLYGRSFWFRGQLAAADIEYYADIPANSKVYLSQPEIGIPTNKRGRKATKPRVLSPRAYRVDQLRQHPSLLWQTVTLRPSERGMLTADFARRRVWTVQEDMTVTEEWLLIRRTGKKHSYSFSNAPTDISLTTWAQRKSQRYFIERCNQDAKSEFGWDVFQATKFTAWEHQLAMTILAQWFIVQTRLDWEAQYARDPELLHHYETDILPALSVANVRTLLRAALPLPQLSPAEATELVVKHLDNRVRSRQSRLRNRAGP